MMTLQDLKEKIINNKFDDKIQFVFHYDDSPLICDQYIEAISRIKYLNIVYLNDLKDYPSNNGIFSIDTNSLYIYKTEKLDKQINSSFTNIIIICNNISDTVAGTIKFDIIKFPKLENWHLIEYIKAACKGLTDTEANQLMTLCNNDSYRIINEVDKIKIFDIFQQKIILENLINSNNFKDVKQNISYQISNYIMKRDLMGLKNLIETNLDVDALELIGVLKKNIFNIIRIQMDPKATADSLKMNYKQFLAIRYNCNKYTNSQLAKIYKFITSLDYRLKSGQLEMSNIDFVNYIICNIITEGA